MENYKGTIDLISGLRPKNGKDFPLMQAHDIMVAEDGTRLDEKLAGAPAIDLSAFETEGVIVETLANGTTKTTTFEFDENGNPVKITDGDGNVTVLTW